MLIVHSPAWLEDFLEAYGIDVAQVGDRAPFRRGERPAGWRLTSPPGGRYVHTDDCGSWL